MPLLETKGAASAQGFGEFAKTGSANYIEDVFSTFLYTGNGSSLAINNGIDLSTKGGLVWSKDRINNASSHILIDTNRWSAGANALLYSDLTNSQQGYTQAITAFNTTGFTLGTGVGVGGNNSNGTNYASWTFRKQPKFFDVVTYTGNGTAGRTVAHDLGSVPGCIIIKRTSATGDWAVYHRSLGASASLNLNLTNASGGGNYWEFTSPTSTQFTLGAGTDVNGNGSTYVAYLFAHNAGGFGLTGTDNVISCGSFNYSPLGTTVNLGYEPQFLLIKSSSQAGDWLVFDNMRGMPGPSTGARYLIPNSANSEAGFGPVITLSATGFRVIDFLTGGADYIYIAIRRGPMKTPTSGTSVFYSQAVPQGDTINSTGVPFPPDLVNTFSRNGTDRTAGWQLFNYVDRLRGLGVPNNTFSGSGPILTASSTSAEVTGNTGYVQLMADSQNITRSSGWNDPQYGSWIYYFFRRAPGFFDVVCYTGNSGTLSVSHNLGVSPELLIIKQRGGSTRDWAALSPLLGGGNYYLTPNSTDAAGFGSPAYYSGLTATTFTLGGQPVTNSSNTYVAYLFASCPGVSKVGTYTGNGTSQTINCGFTGGARFVLIKRTDSTGDWYVWDSARGIVAGNDPYLLLNSTAAEVTNTDYIDTYSAGFEISSTAPAAINANGGSFIFLAIA